MVQRSVLSDAVASICDLVEQHYYKKDHKLSQWTHACFQLSSGVSIWDRKDSVLADLQALMDEMQVSHFLLYTPQEDQKIWKGEAVDTGIRARWVEDHLVIYDILKGSGAEQVGLQKGDDIVSIEGDQAVSPMRVQVREGLYELKRQGRPLKVSVKATALKVDQAPTLQDLSKGKGLLTISSFRGEYFANPAWRQMVSRFSRYGELIIDVRNNPGGNFVAMLRALSPLLCDRQLVGTLLQPRKTGLEKVEFADEIDDQFQIQELDKFKAIQLKSYTNYGCYQKPITVLIDSGSMSVTEIFAQALKSRRFTRVWGQPTAGDVVLAVWYDLPLLGKGFSISIPEAVFLTVQGEEIEGQGVWPQKELYYNLPLALKGIDSWLYFAQE